MRWLRTEKLKWPPPKENHELRRSLACVPTVGGVQLELWALLAADQTYGRVADVSVASKSRSRLLVPESVDLYDTHTRIPAAGLEAHRQNGSNVEFGAVLSQMPEGYENAVAYCSTALSKAARNYCVTWLELLTTVNSHFKLHLRIDHSSLIWLLNFNNLERQTALWVQRLQDYKLHIRILSTAESRQRRCTM
jgi:hypothetical protein